MKNIVIYSMILLSIYYPYQSCFASNNEDWGFKINNNSLKNSFYTNSFENIHHYKNDHIFNENQIIYTNTNNKKVSKHKSYLIAIGGASILPIIGHSYIGGWNIPRGLVYTMADISFYFAALGSALSGLGGYSDSDEKTKLFINLMILNHCINILDATISVKCHNGRVQKLENKVLIEPDFNSGGIRLVLKF